MHHHRPSLGLIDFDNDSFSGGQAPCDLYVRAFGQAGGHRNRCDFATFAVVDPYRVRTHAVLLDSRDGNCQYIIHLLIDDVDRHG